MSYKTVEWFIHAFRELAAAFETENIPSQYRWIKDIEEENEEELSFANESKVRFLLDLHSWIKEKTLVIKRNIEKKKFCPAIIKEVLEKLEKITDQAQVRDKLIKKVIHPIMKRDGWNKKGRSFVKEENGYFKKLLVYSSRNNDYYRVEFTFEMEVEGNGVNIIGERIKKNDHWYKLTEDADLDKIKAQIQVDLEEVKKFFDKYK